MSKIKIVIIGFILIASFPSRWILSIMRCDFLDMWVATVLALHKNERDVYRHLPPLVLAPDLVTWPPPERPQLHLIWWLDHHQRGLIRNDHNNERDIYGHTYLYSCVNLIWWPDHHQRGLIRNNHNNERDIYRHTYPYLCLHLIWWPDYHQRGLIRNDYINEKDIYGHLLPLLEVTMTSSMSVVAVIIYKECIQSYIDILLTLCLSIIFIPRTTFNIWL